MPIRIYALAKDLDIDSKELVEVCNRAGVTGKGSALASLTDDEVAKVKAHLNNDASGTSPTKPAPSRPQAPVRPSAPAPLHKKPPVLQPSKPKPKASEPELAESESVTSDQTTELEETAAEMSAGSDEPTPVGSEETASQEPLQEKPPGKSDRRESDPAKAETTKLEPSRPGAITRDDYIGPGGRMGNKPPMLGGKNKPKGKAGGEGQRPPKKDKPVVKMAAIPKQSEAPAKPKPVEQSQKPVMTLPPDAISRARAGGRAPLEQFTKQHDKKRSERPVGAKGGKTRDEAGGGRGGPAGAGVPAAPATDATSTAKQGKDRKRRFTSGGEEEGGEKKLAGLATARQARQKRRSRGVDDDDERRGSFRSRKRLSRRGGTNTAAPRKDVVTVELPCTVRSLSEASGVPTSQIQRTLMGLGTMATINTELDTELAEMVATEMGMDIQFREPESAEDTLLARFEQIDDQPEDLTTRPPIVTFLGHVDHGKTSLLDRIIGIDVVKGEAGGITQHIRAYKINKDGQKIAFVDTPGHEAFTEMRARGANVTDIAVLVVAADDGVMPQTEEAISHARAAGVPIVVALNKIDLPSADTNKAYQDLSTHGLLPTEWGGDVEVIKTSATSGEGIDDLLETILLTAEIHEYTANPKRAASGVCLEAQQEGDRGVIAKLMVKNGTLNVGDILVCGGAFGKVKALHHTLDTKRKLKSAGPSTPVSLIGLDKAPEAGEPFYVLDDIATAREIAETRQLRQRSKSLSGKSIRVSFEEFQRRMEEGLLGGMDEVAVLRLILRADVRGSIEAIQKELEKLDHPEVKLQILQASVGGITSADVTLADASEAVIIGFNVIPDENARSLADERGVEIRRYDIIYKVTEDLRAMLEGKLKPEEQIKDLGRALVQRVFTISRVGAIAGCRVLAGTIERGCRVRVNRDGRGIGDYLLDSLRREKDDTKEVREGYECGMKLAGFNDLKEGDILEAYKIEEVARSL